MVQISQILVQQLNALCNILPNWVISNGLALNLKKTKYMLFSRQNIELPDEFKILNKKIDRVKEVRFLGVIVDEKLNWSAHIKTLKGKMSRYIKYKILGVHGVIVTNALLFIYKISYIPSLLPIFVRLVIADDAPIPGSTYETNNAWLTIYMGILSIENLYFSRTPVIHKP